MNRLLALSLVAFAVALSPARAQEAPTDTTDLPPVATDSATVIQPDPERARELYNEGRTELQAGNYDGAVLKFEEALLYNDSYAAAALARGQALAQLSRLEDSRNALESAVAMAEASDASNADQIADAARRYLEQINQALETIAQRQAASAQQQQQASAAEKVSQAVAILDGINFTDAEADNYTPAAEAYALLDQAQREGYDIDLVPYYYALALTLMERGADAVPYAEAATEAGASEADPSRYFIVLGLANMSAGNTAEAQAAFETVEEGQAWHGWAQHYIGQLAAEG